MGGSRFPDFIVAGAPRSGTTWLHTVFANHSRVYVPVPYRPEPKFFLVDGEYEKGLAHYADRWFSSAPPGVVAGEKSANYLESPSAARRISSDLPNVRLIFTLREPAERALSNYLWSRMNGLETEDFRTAIKLEGDRERMYPEEHRFSRPHSYFSRGLYATHLRPYLELFGREQIKVLRYEDIVAEPKRVAEEVLHFIGVDPGDLDAAAIGRINASEGPERTERFDDVLLELRERYKEPNVQLQDLLGPEFVGWGY